MELHFTHASRRLATKATPLEVQKLVITGDQPKLTQLFARRYAILTKRGELDNLPGRLINRKPVEVKPPRVQWAPPPKSRVKKDVKVAYDHPGLTVSQRASRTCTTKGEALDMTNKVAEQRGGRKSRVLKDLSK